MRNRFRVRAKAAPLGRFLFVGVIAFLSLLCMEVYRLMTPFVSANPLWTQVTIGQPVIHGWMYGGVDEEGYLKFYNQASPPITIPPDAHMFDADGEFVILEGHTPSSLTFAQPYEAIPTRWLVVGFAVIAIPTALLVLKYRLRRRGMKLKMNASVQSRSGGVQKLRSLRFPVRVKSLRNKQFRTKRRPR